VRLWDLRMDRLDCWDCGGEGVEEGGGGGGGW
jgi:hypothetical protein